MTTNNSTNNSIVNPVCMYYCTTATTSVYTSHSFAITFDTAQYDNSSMIHSSGAYFVVPSVGVYKIYAQAQYTPQVWSPLTSYFGIFIYTGSAGAQTTNIGGNYQGGTATTYSNNAVCSLSSLVNITNTTSQTISVLASSNTGSGNAVIVQGQSPPTTYIIIEKVSS